jgi:hypothetical protein
MENQPDSHEIVPSERERVREHELLEALARIYHRYGNDLESFRRDVEKAFVKAQPDLRT